MAMLHMMHSFSACLSYIDILPNHLTLGNWANFTHRNNDVNEKRGVARTKTIERQVLDEVINLVKEFVLENLKKKREWQRRKKCQLRQSYGIFPS